MPITRSKSLFPPSAASTARAAGNSDVPIAVTSSVKENLPSRNAQILLTRGSRHFLDQLQAGQQRAQAQGNHIPQLDAFLGRADEITERLASQLGQDDGSQPAGPQQMHEACTLLADIKNHAFGGKDGKRVKAQDIECDFVSGRSKLEAGVLLTLELMQDLHDLQHLKVWQHKSSAGTA